MSSIQSFVKLSLLSLALAGCTSLSSTQPLNVREQAVPESCYATYGGTRLTQVRAIASALEAQGYEVRASDVELGLVSAERIRRQPGLGATRLWRGSSFGWFGGRRGGFMLGSGFNDPYDVFRSDPSSVERVSVSADGQRYLAVRSVTVVSPDGFVIDARPASPEPFCQQTHAAIDQALASSGDTP
ncbi:hypothetical protein [Kushneria phyllosphaerae]|uniref:DUF4136 domain-containing protein n=1 Tax=Kushneria phyllosphaerae TaxID=2100822 RepID=A0A2R8CJN4_9GAMM|nr:hypothetical protein [Kushneria phyllosphaerae]SPJ33100.1 hypothetical protein KSP9073_01103 [Kushneria phyllosphaerae]